MKIESKNSLFFGSVSFLYCLLIACSNDIHGQGQSPNSTGIASSVSGGSECGILFRAGQLNTQRQGNIVDSCDRKFSLIFSAGELQVIENKAGNPVVWSSKTAGKNVDRVVFHASGNLILSSGQAAVWHTNTENFPEAILRLQNDGNLVIYSREALAGDPSSALWSSLHRVAGEIQKQAQQDSNGHEVDRSARGLLKEGVSEARLHQARVDVLSAVYRVCFGREADAPGFAFWFSQLPADTHPEDVRTAVCDRSVEGQIAQLYFDILARDPDENGRSEHVMALRSGTSLATIRERFETSAEAKDPRTAARRQAFQTERIARGAVFREAGQRLLELFDGSLSPKLVRGLPAPELEKVPVPCGPQAPQLGVGCLPPVELSGAQNSTGGQITLEPVVTPLPSPPVPNRDLQLADARLALVKAVGKICLGRELDLSGLGFWSQKVAQGLLADALKSEVCRSQEALIADLYFSVLARDPDEGGSRWFIQQLQNGRSLLDIRREFETGAEALSGQVQKRRGQFDAVRLEREGVFQNSKATLASQSQ